MLSLLTANPMGQAIIAMFFGSGCRKGEVAALDWKDYERGSDGAIVHLRRNSWRGKIITLKTKSSKDNVAIDAEICKYVDSYREMIGNPTEGPMFHNQEDNGNIINLDSFARWQIKPILERCHHCGKQQPAHTQSDHRYERNETVPHWKGWHAFRRGNATFLAQQRTVDGRAAATLMLRQSDASTTEDHYILETKQERRAAQAAKVIDVRQRRRQAAKAIGESLKSATVI